MIVITGAGGFIGSRLLNYFSKHGINNLLLVDDFNQYQKWSMVKNYPNINIIHRDQFLNWLSNNHNKVDIIYHLGARTDTTEMNTKIFDKLNFAYSVSIFNLCGLHGIPLIYASSAATYGDGEFGYSDDFSNTFKLKPLNPYGQSKQDFDIYALSSKENEQPPYWAGLKFFNVFGYGEYNKGRMASVVYHGMKQIKETTKLKLFKSYNPDYQDGKQMRDFIWVEDVVRILASFYGNMEILQPKGVYNLGSGVASTFLELGTAMFRSMIKFNNFEFIDMPMDLRDKYQYYTKANMNKLSLLGIDVRCTPLSKAVRNYINDAIEEM